MRIHFLRFTSIVAACLAVPAVFALLQSPSRAQAPSAALTIASLPSPAGANSTEPQITVQGDHLILSWLELSGERTTLKFAERTVSGWSAPHAVFSGNDFFVNSFDVPSVRVLDDGTLAANWLANNGANTDATKVLLSWSRDHGHTWSKPVSPHHDGTETEHGFASLFQAPGAGLGLIWIDGRATNPEKETGDMSLRASIFSPQGKQLDETVVDPRVCECCSTAAVQTSEGVIVAFRNRSADEIRDIYVARYASGHWSAPSLVHDDNWRITGCPINGPAISAGGREVAVAWFVGKDEKGRAFVAFSHDAGHTFGAPVRVDDANSLGRLGVQMLDDGSAVVTWIEAAAKHSELRARAVSRAGMRSPSVLVAQAPGSRYPRVARYGDELLFSWAEGNDVSSRVRTARASIAGK